VSNPSQSAPFLYIWSLERLVLSISVLIVTLYFVYSTTNRELAFFNSYIFLCVLISLLSLEGIFRLFPHYTPSSLRPFLPVWALEKIADYREEGIGGEGMVFRYKPNTHLVNYPHVVIDAMGFRNSNEIHDKKSIDVVLLGDSMLMALAASEDLGAILRDKGISALNLGMGGYSPQHYRDVYFRFVQKKRIRHKWVFVFVYAGNDFRDAVLYERTRGEALGYREYIYNPRQIEDNTYKSWVLKTLELIPGMLKALKTSYRSPEGVDSLSVENVFLPYRTIAYPLGPLHDAWWPPRITADDDAWQYCRDALSNIVALAKDSGAIPLIVLLPPPSSIYASFNSEFCDAKKNMDQIASLIRDEVDCKLIDTGPILQKAIAGKFIYASNMDCHYNDAGVNTIYRMIDEILGSASGNIDD
jgi:hypothetical protein